MRLTLSVIKADTGGFVGHTDVHPRMIEHAKACAREAVSSGLLLDAHVSRCGRRDHLAPAPA